VVGQRRPLGIERDVCAEGIDLAIRVTRAQATNCVFVNGKMDVEYN